MSSPPVCSESSISDEFLHFVNGCHSEFHAVQQTIKLLTKAGFEEISERNDVDWTTKIKPMGKYFFTRNQSCIIAFAVGGNYKNGNGFAITGAHTDSPVLKVKPVSKDQGSGFMQVGVECYGGGLWNTWFDRNLTVAGRVIVQTEEEDGKPPKYECKLVHIPRPILCIPNLAIHLNRGIYTEGFKYNKQTHLLPILATEMLNKEMKMGDEAKASDEHHFLLLVLLAKELKVPMSSIKDFDLSLCDTQPACLHGAWNEFISARGLDNLMMSFICTKALIAATDEKSLKEAKQIQMVALFDNEEVGSTSQQGANSNLMVRLLQRIHGDDMKVYDAAIRKSFLVSADMAHALHPNYTSKHEHNHRPIIHKGLVIKKNSNQRYATNAITTFILEEIAKKHKIPLQKFVVRNDMGCGSTIGPLLSAKLGIRTLDVGVPQFAMHSIREMCGTRDVLSSFELLKNFYLEFEGLDSSLTVDK
mmetsp:Transcript_14554/g.23727  ORF Transcript_14554/g.23727 Transcript_14554/m.23727 type:complete len:474 (+) Transcript_14554:52-1473(+)